MISRHLEKPRPILEQELCTDNEMANSLADMSGKEAAVDSHLTPHFYDSMCDTGPLAQAVVEAKGDSSTPSLNPHIDFTREMEPKRRNDYSNEAVNSDFFTNPIQKMLQNRRFPFKLTVSCLMFVVYILLITLYHKPEFIQNELQRRAILHHFLGENYLGKDKGNVVLRPTIYLYTLEDVRKAIKDFVTVYYALSNTSVNDLQYYYYANAGEEDGITLLRRLAYDDTPQLLEGLHTKLLLGMDESVDQKYELNLSWVRPVSMNLEAYLYSPQEHRGPTPRRSFSFLLTEADPLGPFGSEDNDPVESESDHLSKNSSMSNDSMHEGGISSFASAEGDYVDTVCAPRYDDIAKLYYNPCRRSSEGKEGAFVFPLLDNVRSISLTASVRHLSDATVARHDSTSGFSAIVYHWTVKKNFFFHGGGLVEVTFDTSVMSWGVQLHFHPRLLLLFLLLLLTIYDMWLRHRALLRIKAFQQNIVKATATKVASSSSQDRLKKVCDSEGEGVGFNASTTTAHLSGLDHPESSGSLSDVSTSSKMPLRASSHFSSNLVYFNSSTNAPRRVGRSKGGIHPMVKTTYTDFHDVCRQQLQKSKGKGWHYISIFSDIIAIFYISLSSLRLAGLGLSGLYNDVVGMVCGLSGLFMCVNLLSYLRYFPRIYFTLQATQNVIPKLLLFVVTISPVFIGFAFFFWIVFGPHSDGLFSDLNFSFVVLYFVMYGDAILPTIETAEGSVFVAVKLLANLMTVIFVLLFMMTMLNLAMAITQYEWVMLRRRFGTCFSVGNMLFTVRTRDQVKEDALKSVIANLELLLILGQEELLSSEIPKAAAETDEGRTMPIRREGCVEVDGNDRVGGDGGGDDSSNREGFPSLLAHQQGAGSPTFFLSEKN